MRYEFWLRALGPHLVLAAVLSTACPLIGSSAASLCFAPILAAAQLAAWYWTDLLLTDRVKGARMVRESREYTDADGRPRKEPEAMAWLLLAAVFQVVSLFLLASGVGLLAGVVFLAIDLPL